MAPSITKTELLTSRVSRLEQTLAEYLPPAVTANLLPIKPETSSPENSNAKSVPEARQLRQKILDLEKTIRRCESKVTGLTDTNRSFLQRTYLLHEVRSVVDSSLDTDTKLSLLVAAKSDIETLYVKLNRVEKLSGEAVDQPILEQTQGESLERLEAQFANTQACVNAYHRNVLELLAKYSETMDAVSRLFLACASPSSSGRA